MKNKEVVISNVSIDENYIITKDNKKMYIYNNKIYKDNTKINKKYGIENTTDDIVIKYEPREKLTSILKPYIMPVAISTIIILIYAFIRYMKLGSFKTIGKYLLAIIVPELVYASILVICRIPVNRFVATIGLIVYAVSIVTITMIKEKQLKIAKLADKK